MNGSPEWFDPPQRKWLRGTKCPDAVERFERHLRAMRREAVEAARALAEIDACAHWTYEGCSSIAQFGERHGASASEARQLVAMAKALDTYKTLESDLTSGRTSFQSAATLGRLVQRAEQHKDVPFDPLAWAERAREEPARVLARDVDEWLEKQRIGAQPVSITAFLSRQGAEDFTKASEIASRKAKRVLSTGEAVERISSHYLDSFDLTRKTPRKRRLAPTDLGTTPFDRYVAAEVRREIAKRQRGCAVPRCPNTTFRELSHRVAHVNGGSREAYNLDDICTQHHAMYEQGLLKIEGPTDAPRFYDARGRQIVARSEWDFDVSDPEFDVADALALRARKRLAREARARGGPTSGRGPPGGSGGKTPDPPT